MSTRKTDLHLILELVKDDEEIEMETYKEDSMLDILRSLHD